MELRYGVAVVAWGTQINDSPSWQPKAVRTPGSTNQHIYLGFSPPPPLYRSHHSATVVFLSRHFVIGLQPPCPHIPTKMILPIFMSIPGPLAAVMHALHFGWAFDGGAMR